MQYLKRDEMFMVAFKAFLKETLPSLCKTQNASEKEIEHLKSILLSMMSDFIEYLEAHIVEDDFTQPIDEEMKDSKDYKTH